MAWTDKEKVEVAIYAGSRETENPDIIFSTSLYAINFIVEISDFSSLIEEYFRQHNLVANDITLSVDDVSVIGHFLYCEFAMPDSFDPEKALFLASSVQRVHQDSTVAIAAIDRVSSTPFIFRIVGHLEESKTLAVVEKQVSAAFNREFTAYFRVPDIIGWALASTDVASGEKLVDVTCFSISYGTLQKMFYVVPAPAYLTFSFRNIFNVEEFIDVVGEIVTKTEVERESAFCGRTLKFYDRVVSRTYEIQTEPLAFDEVPIFEQLISSHEVKMYINGNDEDVMITEHTCEPSSSDDSLTIVKFSWRFAENRPRIFDDSFRGILPDRKRIFDDSFSPEYE